MDVGNACYDFHPFFVRNPKSEGDFTTIIADSWYNFRDVIGSIMTGATSKRPGIFNAGKAKGRK